ncbi:MAG: 16S rRNA (adenine(1518)-N(6)/adenine(1519)-N(6))-dimethyltransferase RsmA [Gammaproteobacteria bacterium]|nr:16S rRNA (adenine(1518)-N(6)/adenine(1519)-N(6))-dimethyltransferase RsmA [Gammaproteobacteria bacterium]
MRARKRFGQHFLHDQGVVERMLRALAPAPADRVVEIGPGPGALTYPLLDHVPALDVVELDRDLAARLEAHPAAAAGRLRVHRGDVLRFDFGALAGPAAGLRLVGNLPYNISTPLLFHLFDQLDAIRDMHFMLQREVVARMAAAPGSKTYGRLSVMVQYHCRVERLFGIGPGAFTPPPRVHSEVVRLVPHAEPPVTVVDPESLQRVVRAAFGQRRKTLRNALQGLVDAEAMAAAGIDPGQRPERLFLADFARLADLAADYPAAPAPTPSRP